MYDEENIKKLKVSNSTAEINTIALSKNSKKHRTKTVFIIGK